MKKTLGQNGLNFIANKYKELRTALSNKVDKISGKGLSTNDYDSTAKAKVDAIPNNPKYTDTTYDLSKYAEKSDISRCKTKGYNTSSTWQSLSTTRDLEDWIGDFDKRTRELKDGGSKPQLYQARKVESRLRLPDRPNDSAERVEWTYLKLGKIAILSFTREISMDEVVRGLQLRSDFRPNVNICFTVPLIYYKQVAGRFASDSYLSTGTAILDKGGKFYVGGPLLNDDTYNLGLMPFTVIYECAQ